MSTARSQNNYESQWKEVENLVNKGLPQSALKIVDEIYASSKSENNAPQFLKAILYQVRLRADYQEDFMESSLSQISAELASSQSPVTAILLSIRAELHWRYYQANRYLFMDRTRVTSPDLSDIKTWDLETLIHAVAADYKASLAPKEMLQAVQLGMFDPILEKEKGSEIYRPTLYDFLAHRALEFYSNDEAGVTRPATVFTIDSKEYFNPAPQFSLLQLAEPGEEEYTLQALHIYQDLILFHLLDGDPAALIDADLERIRFVLDHAVIPERNDAYLHALQKLQANFPDHPGSADVAHEIALEYYRRGELYNPFISEENRWDLKTARQICESTIQRFPAADGATNCHVLLQNLLGKSLSVSLPEACLPGKPGLASLGYKNLEGVHFRLIRYDAENDRELRQNLRGAGLIEAYLKIPALKEWHQSLPDDGDLQDHTTMIGLPELNAGHYILLASPDEGFNAKKNPVAYTSFWVTSISYISTGGRDGEMKEIFILDRLKGTPLRGVTAQAFTREYDYKTRTYTNKPLDLYISDNEGRVAIQAAESSSRTFYIEFRLGNDRYYTDAYFYVYPAVREEPDRNATFFFTDRSIYRPGQTVYFKGIVLKKTGDTHEIVPGETSTIALHDVHGQKVSEVLLTTNDFGSFQGSFTIPSAGLTGEMSLRNPWGSIYFSVEEYKRPKFRVEIDSLKGSYKLNETVNVSGKAITYSGNPVDQAQVSYRVVRTARFPVWRDWWIWFPSIPETEIVSGTAQTSTDGMFSLDFQAHPDPQVPSKYQPVFNFTVYVDVTDINGEVRSAERTVSVGYQALLMDFDAAETINLRDRNTFMLTTANLNGQPLEVEGKLSLFPLQPSERLIREQRWQRPDVFVMDREEFTKSYPNEEYDNESDPETWALGEALFTADFNTGESRSVTINNLQDWQPGMYLIVMEAMDGFGDSVTVKEYITAFDPDSKRMPVSKPFWHTVVNGTCEPGDTAVIMAGTAEKNVRLLFEVENRGKIITRQWLEMSQESKKLEIPVMEGYRGNFFINLVFVKENRSYHYSQKITVPYSNKELDILVETFRDKLTPGQEEEWRIRVTGEKGDAAAAELLSAMYDASLDAFREHAWSFSLYPGRSQSIGWETGNAFAMTVSAFVNETERREFMPVSRKYDRLNWFGFNYFGSGYPYRQGMMMKNMDGTPAMADEESAQGTTVGEGLTRQEEEQTAEKMPDVPVRKNFTETAFFFPSLRTDENGDVILKFTMPESLTAWKFMVLSHTKDLETGYFEKELVTRKDLMVLPNYPRFFREGDQVVFSAKIMGTTTEKLQGKVTAEFFDALTMQPIDEMLGNEIIQQGFAVSEGASQVCNWQVLIPMGLEAVVVRIKATAGAVADGEEMIIPVLPNRMLVTESFPLPVSGEGMKNFKFSRLTASGKSASLKNYRLTLEFTSNPAWYAVQALPYLAEDRYESADNIFSRYYANTLAAFIANANPKIRQVFEQWKNLTPDALLSNLEKNQELKSVLLQETPWVLEARNESERKKRIALLFDLNRMADEQQAALRKLQQMQSPNGGWPWFEGMPDNRYITQLIVTGIGKLNHMGAIDINREPGVSQMVQRALIYLDERAREDYERIKEMSGEKVGENHLSPVHVQYLYARSFLDGFREIGPSGREAYRYFQEQASLYWLDQQKYIQGMIALSLHRLGVAAIPGQIINSLRENALTSDEMGMYWRDLAGYSWFEAPVERQAMMIEAFGEVVDDKAAVENMKIWLLKQKQTQDWKSTRATADAVYALLLRGTDLLASDELVEVTVGSEPVDPLGLDNVNVEAGTGYFQATWHGSEIRPEMGNVKVNKKTEGVAWGALYWQYFEQLDKITPAKTPLSVEKELYVKYNTADGPELLKIDDDVNLRTGDRVVSRIIIRVDRDMEYVHMKDMRAAAFEPVNTLSGYRYQGGLGYYESIRDASVNFFFDYLRKGTYVFEYELNTSQKGSYSNGITTIQCLYAPEFSAHSGGVKVWVE